MRGESRAAVGLAEIARSARRAALTSRTLANLSVPRHRAAASSAPCPRGQPCCLVGNWGVGKSQLLASPPFVRDVVDNDRLPHTLNSTPLKAMIRRRRGDKDEGAVAGKRRAANRCLVGVVDIRSQTLMLRIC